MFFIPQSIAAVILAVTWALTALPANAEITSLKGKIAFAADTNMRMFHFAGQTTDFQASVDKSGKQLSHLEIRIPVNSLTTGIDIRDKHMRERIFTASDGSTPDIVYSASQIDCHDGSSSSSRVCQVGGQLTFRGETHPQAVEVTLKNGDAVDGNVKVDVTTWGVTQKQLSYSGINVVKLVNLDFSVRLQ